MQRITADARCFFDTDLTVSIGEVSTSIRGIFSDGFQQLRQNEMQVESTGPGAIVATADVSEIAHGDTVTHEGTTYYVTGIQPDGHGLTFLKLSREPEDA